MRLLMYTHESRQSNGECSTRCGKWLWIGCEKLWMSEDRATNDPQSSWRSAWRTVDGCGCSFNLSRRIHSDMVTHPMTLRRLSTNRWLKEHLNHMPEQGLNSVCGDIVKRSRSTYPHYPQPLLR
jgi:hypothetical protein